MSILRRLFGWLGSKAATLQVIEARGDNYVCGRAYGTSARRNIRYRLEQFVDDDDFEAGMDKLRAVHATCERRYPQYLREIEGIADGAGVDYWKLFYFNVPEIADADSGCTSIASRQNGEVVLVHNEDGGSGERARDGVLLHYVLPAVSFYAFAYAGELPGACYGWNAHGVFHSVNYLEPIDEDIAGRLPRTFTARSLLEATDVEDGIARLKAARDASGYHYYLGKGSRIVCIEQFRDDVSVKEVGGIEVHSNHYLHAGFAERADAGKHSRVRYQQARKLLLAERDPLQVLADRTNAPFSICTRKDEELHTLSTVRFRPSQRKVEIFEPETLTLYRTFDL
jgi:hypothetical protein